MVLLYTSAPCIGAHLPALEKPWIAGGPLFYPHPCWALSPTGPLPLGISRDTIHDHLESYPPARHRQSHTMFRVRVPGNPKHNQMYVNRKLPGGIATGLVRSCNWGRLEFNQAAPCQNYMCKNICLCCAVPSGGHSLAPLCVTNIDFLVIFYLCHNRGLHATTEP